MATTKAPETTIYAKRTFTFSNLKTRGLTLFIEHLPCCLISFGAAFLGLPLVFQHNPWLEFSFALGGALIGERIGHKFFHNNADTHHHTWQRRYMIAIVIGLLSWGVHQAIFHDPPQKHTHAHSHTEEITKIKS